MEQGIDGYTHKEGIRNLLRVKRYKIANPPADSANQIDVLDIIEESEFRK